MGSDVDQNLIERINADPAFRELVEKRSRLAWVLTALIMVIYFGFILAIAFARDLVAEPIAGGVTTLGIPLGIGVIIAAFILTGIYVVRANSEFDDLNRTIIERARQ